MIEISEEQEAAIHEIKQKLSSHHRDAAGEALLDSLKLGGIAVEKRAPNYRYIASWKLHQKSGTWLARVYVAIEVAMATCTALTSYTVSDAD